MKFNKKSYVNKFEISLFFMSNSNKIFMNSSNFFPNFLNNKSLHKALLYFLNLGSNLAKRSGSN